MSMIAKPNRRSFLSAAAGLFAAAPILRPGQAFAQDVTKRLVVFIVPNGVRQNDWFSGDINALGQFLSPLQPYSDRLSVLRGLTNRAAFLSSGPDHIPDFHSILTGRPPVDVGSGRWSPKGASIDEAVGAWTMEQSDAPSVACLRFGARAGGHRAFSYTENGSQIRPENDPYRMFDRHFASLDADASQLEAIRAQKQSVLDLVLADVQQVRCASGVEEKRVLDAHLERLRAVERQIQSIEVSSCEPPTLEQGLSAGNDRQLIELGRAHQSMLALSLACGVTRVATMQHNDGGKPAFSEGNDRPWHAASHDNALSGDIRQAVDYAHMRWPAKQFRHLLDELDSYQETDGTLLDHTMVLWVHEQGSTPTHDRFDHCAVVAGGTRAGLVGGQVIDFGGRRSGRVHSQTTTNKPLVTAAQFMGLGLDKFGDDRVEKGPLTQLLA